MQIKLRDCERHGLRRRRRGLLDGETNLTYAIPYLANAPGSRRPRRKPRALYAGGGYYYVAKRGD